MTDSKTREKSFGRMESYLRESSKMEKETVLVFSNGPTEANTSENGEMGKRMDLVLIKTRLVIE
jgi:hypothetical protein